MRNRLNRTISVLLLVTTVFCSFICFSSCKKEQEAAPVPDVSGFTGNRIYFAAPLFSEAEREYNLYLTNILRSCLSNKTAAIVSITVIA